VFTVTIMLLNRFPAWSLDPVSTWFMAAPTVDFAPFKARGGRFSDSRMRDAQRANAPWEEHLAAIDLSGWTRVRRYAARK